ncbi:MAG TPA: hypothetical protein VFZ53_18600 [Polyangiaceae bacterium]
MGVTLLFPSRWIFRAFFIFLLVLSEPSHARANEGRVPPPRDEIDAGPPPLPRAPERARRPFALAAALDASLPACGHAFRGCGTPTFGAGGAIFHRPLPYFAFGAALGFARAAQSRLDPTLERELIAGGALGRVYFYEEGAFDPYLELELGYASLRTLASTAGGFRESRAFGPMARAGGGIDFVVLPGLALGGALGYRQLVFETCASRACRAGAGPLGGTAGAIVLGVRATFVLGAPL